MVDVLERPLTRQSDQTVHASHIELPQASKALGLGKRSVLNKHSELASKKVSFSVSVDNEAADHHKEQSHELV